jgi:hypothetical protein
VCDAVCAGFWWLAAALGPHGRLPLLAIAGRLERQAPAQPANLKFFSGCKFRIAHNLTERGRGGSCVFGFLCTEENITKALLLLVLGYW